MRELARQGFHSDWTSSASPSQSASFRWNSLVCATSATVLWEADAARRITKTRARVDATCL